MAFLDSISGFLNTPVGGVINDPGGLGTNLPASNSALGQMTNAQLISLISGLDKSNSVSAFAPLLGGRNQQKRNGNVFSLSQLNQQMQQKPQSSDASDITDIASIFGAFFGVPGTETIAAPTTLGGL